MRPIGMKDVECFDGPCQPWTKDSCRSCAIRPMKIYQGNGNSHSIRKYCRTKGYGLMVSPGGCSTPQHFDHYAIDNGAFSAWINNRTWDGNAYLLFLSRLISIKQPDFLVVPDLVAKGQESLDFSLKWRDELPRIQTRHYLAVQDGMKPNIVRDVIKNFEGIFVGGTIDWKLATGASWASFAHDRNLPCHVGRVGTWERIVWARSVGMDSIDSSSWPQNDSFHHIETARNSTTLKGR